VRWWIRKRGCGGGARSFDHELMEWWSGRLWMSMRWYGRGARDLEYGLLGWCFYRARDLDHALMG